MDDGIPGVKQARYRLLGLEAMAAGDGVVVRRGNVRFRVPGEAAGALLDLLVERSAEGNGVSIEELKAEIDPSQHGDLIGLVDRLSANRLFIPFEIAGSGDERREDIFYWNHGTTRAVTEANVDRVAITVFGVNHVALPLLGNLRSCGFRTLTLVDHPALRNLDFFDDSQQLRGEVAGAISVELQSFDDWQAAGARPDCQVVCSDFGGLALMRDWNRACVAANCLFYPAVLQDEVAFLGPLVVPGEGPCFECLWSRQSANLAESDRDRASETHPFFGQAVSGYLQPMARVAADIAATELLKFFSRTLGAGPTGQRIEVDLMAPALTTRTVLKVPRCPVCSSVGAFVEPGEDAPRGD